MPIGRGRAAALSMLAGLVAPVSAMAEPVRPIYREIGDWLIACDNVRDCVARQAPEPGRATIAHDEADAGVDIVRKGGPAGALLVRVAAGARLNPSTIRPAARTASSALPWRRSADGEDASLSGDAARRFIAAIVDAPVLRVGRARLSLRGLAAVLLAMDEAQGRIGTVTALVRPGPRPASAVPTPPLPPAVRVAPSAGPPLASSKAPAASVRRLNARLLADHDCDIDPAALNEAYPLTSADALVVIGCGRFAYQTSVLAFRVPRDRLAQARLLQLPEPRGAAGMATPGDPAMMSEYIDGRYDPATRVFAEQAKGRGLADCGSATEWTFNGAAFRLSAFRWQDRCAGRAGDWPVLYRTRR